jgi:hypothetical protein
MYTYNIHIQAGEHVACTGKKNAHKVSVQNPVRKTPLRKCKHRWEKNTKMGIQKIRREGVHQIYLVQDRDKWPSLVNKEMNPCVQ